MRLGKQDLLLFCIVCGVMVFFLGMVASFVLGPSTTSYQVPWQVSTVVKLTGMGIVCLSLILGSFFVEKIERDSRVLLLIFGVILLLVNVALMSTYRY
jgi:hypothetical protein